MKENNFDIIFISANSVTIELNNNDCYYTEEYSLFLDDKEYKFNKNVVSIYDLLPNTLYKIRINDTSKEFMTLNKKFIYYDNKGVLDDTKSIQDILDNIKEDEVLVLNDTYHVISLFVKDNTSIYLTKNAKLIGETDRTKYPILKADEYLNGLPLGTWEGRSEDSFSSIINLLGVRNVNIYGEGVIDCNACNSDWWINHRELRIARRPKGIFIHTSKDVVFEGFKVCNTPSWNQHSFYSENLSYINLRLENPFDSPTTDGCDPESCNNVKIIGNFISVGDDCIAIKSSKIELARIYKRPSSNIIIRNNLMNHGHAGVTLGSENSGGINNVVVNKCVFKSTDRGLRIKSQRGRGDLAIMSNIVFDNIIMDSVLSPFVINAFYKAGNDNIDYRFSKQYIPKDETTPSFKEFKFSNIECKNVSYGVGFFLGLPESIIEYIELNNINITYNKDAKEGIMAMCADSLKYKNVGFVCENVGTLKLNNVNFIDEATQKFILKNVSEIIENN